MPQKEGAELSNSPLAIHELTWRVAPEHGTLFWSILSKTHPNFPKNPDFDPL